ncbi:MAG: rhomboid family intramembrane serine protease [Flavobacterium sp.]
MNILDDLKLEYKTGGIAVKLIIWNVVCFLISIPLFYQFKITEFDFPNWLCLVSSPSDLLLRPWTLVTYAFLHNSFWHLLFNMMVLNFSSRLFLTYFTQKQLLSVYILGGIFAGLIFVFTLYFLNVTAPIVGASAAIMAVLVGVTTYQPLMSIRLLLIGYVKLWHLTGVILLLDLLQIGLSNEGGHISHLAGALFGFVYIKTLQNGTDLGSGLNTVLDWFANIFSPQKSTPFKKVHRNPRPANIGKSTSKIVTKDKTQQQIDEILDKISKSGYDSLTADEKEFLFKAGKQ